MKRVVVVGGGLAGLEAVTALRAQGFGGGLILVSAEAHHPYDKPPLSKEILTTERDTTTLEASWGDLDVDIKLDCAATGVADHLLTTASGDIEFDGLVIATGTSPVQIPVLSQQAPVCYLRTIDDALNLRQRLAARAHVVVVGAGWIGAEVATAAAVRGCTVTVVEAMEAPLATALPVEVGMLTAGWYKEVGAELLLGTRVVDITGDDVELEHGRRLKADIVVVGVGVRPETDWLEGSSVNLDDRGFILVDEAMRTSVPGIVAAGDCTSWPSTRYAKRMRTGHWDHALRSPEVAVSSLLGGQLSYDPVPYFWSDQLGRSIQYVGHWSSADTIVFRGDPQSGPWSACWTNDGRLTALLAIDRPRDVSQGRKLIADGERIDPALLADPDVALKNVVST
jgi:3-phenylpropionate/trans-cinnamate dioxygenase ferredoxin reductase component